MFDGGVGDASGDGNVIITDSGGDTLASDAGSDAADAADADPGPFTPGHLAGLAVWFNTDVGVVIDPTMAGHVKRWADQSVNGNDGVAENNEPTIDPVARNGHDAIAGAGGFFLIPDTPSLHWGIGAFAISMVMRADPGTTGNVDKAGGGLGISFFAIAAPPSLRLLVGDQALDVSAPSGASFHVITLRGPTVETRIDGVSTTGGTNTQPVANATLSVFSTGVGPEIMEFVAVNGSVSDGNILKLEAYLKTKYNL